MAQTRQTVERALDLLNCFSEARPSWTVSELSAITGLEKSIVSRLLATLQSKGFVYKESNNVYYLGERILELADTVRKENQVCTLGEGILYDLSQKTGETVVVGLRRGRSCQFIKVIESKQFLRVGPKLGAFSPLHAGAIGKSILAFSSDAEIELYVRHALEKITPNTLDNPDLLLKELSQIRKDRVAVSAGEIDAFTAAVATPIFDNNNVVNMSICLEMPVSRFKSPNQYTGVLIETADALNKMITSR